MRSAEDLFLATTGAEQEAAAGDKADRRWNFMRGGWGQGGSPFAERQES
jgi:hypothetical protein